MSITVSTCWRLKLCHITCVRVVHVEPGTEKKAPREIKDVYLRPRTTDLVAKKGDGRLFCRGNNQLGGGGHQVSQHLPLRPIASHLNRVLRYCDVGEYILDCTKDLFENSYGILALQAMSSLRSWDDHPVQKNDTPANASVVLLHRAGGPSYLHCSSFFAELYGHFFDALFRPPSLKLCPLPSICGLVHTLPFCHGPHSRKKGMEPLNIIPTFCWQDLTPKTPLLVGPSRQNLFWEIKHQLGCSIKGKK